MTENTAGNASVLATLFAHNAWANVKLLDFCEKLSPEQLGTNAVGGFGTIHETLIHILRAEQGYVERTNGKTPPQPLVRGQALHFDQLKDVARWASDELLQLALATRSDTLVKETDDKSAIEYPLASLLMQSLTHSTEHRTQIAAIITQLGMEPPDMSGWMYMEEHKELREWDL